MEIEGCLNIWVTSIKDQGESGLLIDGVVFDGEYGFGSEDKREFSGKIFILAVGTKAEENGSIELIHFTKGGLLWKVDLIKLPSTPFLLTSSSNLSIISLNRIDLIPTEDTVKIFDRDVSAYYPVRSNGLIGVLFHSQDGDILFGFEGEQEKESCASRLIFSEWNLDVGHVS